MTELSVLMPARNASRTVYLAVASTLAALPKDAELLVMLDGCTDDTELKLSKITDPRLRIFKFTEPQGVARSLNRLIQESQAPYIARMDSDDICLPMRFKRQLKEIKALQVDFLFFQAIIFGASLFPLVLRPQLLAKLNPKQSPLALCLGNPFVHPAMIAKASAIRALNGYREVPAEDYDLWLRAASSSFNIHRSPRYGILYRVHKNQLTQQPDWQLKFNSDGSIEPELSKLASLLGIDRNIMRTRLAQSNLWLSITMVGISGTVKWMWDKR